MTCGIYKLEFKGTKKVYIGQSTNIEKRFLQHIRSIRALKASQKLLGAVEMYGEPTLDILIIDIPDNLDALEDECIEIWDSVNNGFNCYYYANQAPIYKGFGSANSKYSKEQVTTVFNLLVSTDLPYINISETTEVAVSTITKIACMSSHLWLKEEYPESFKLLESKYLYRSNYKVVSDKLSAKSKGIIYPKILDPSGNTYEITNAYAFAKSKGLAPNHFQEVLNKVRKSHKGWKLA